MGAQVSYIRTEIMPAIPSSASLTISECSILVVDYIIEVSTCDGLRSHGCIDNPVYLSCSDRCKSLFGSISFFIH